MLAGRAAIAHWILVAIIGTAVHGEGEEPRAADEATAQAEADTAELDDDPFDDPFADDESPGESGRSIPDPWEKLNRKMFSVNDKLYLHVLRPVAKGYAKVIPQSCRVGVRKFFSNVSGPARAANCLFQGRFRDSGIEVARFVTNSTLGLGGLFDPARSLELGGRDGDLGQTLGHYGMGPGFYIVWPVVGPSSPRHTLGLVGDLFLHPWPYVTTTLPRTGIGTYGKVNVTSLKLGEYEDFKASAIDPYLAMRNAYYQYRESKIKDVGRKTSRRGNCDVGDHLSW